MSKVIEVIRYDKFQTRRIPFFAEDLHEILSFQVKYLYNVIVDADFLHKVKKCMHHIRRGRNDENDH